MSNAANMMVLVLAVLAIAACGSDGNNGTASQVAEAVPVAGEAATSPGKPQAGAVQVSTEAASDEDGRRRLLVALQPVDGVAISAVRFPEGAAMKSLDVRDFPQAKYTASVRLLELDVALADYPERVPVLLQLEADGKRFAQYVQVPVTPGSAEIRPRNELPEMQADAMQEESLVELPAEQTIRRQD